VEEVLRIYNVFFVSTNPNGKMLLISLNINIQYYNKYILPPDDEYTNYREV